MNNGVGRTPVGGLGPRLALGTDGIGSDMFEESHAAYFRLREDDLAGSPDWSLARLGESARLAGRVYDEPQLGTLEPGAPADLVVLDYPAPAPVTDASFAGHWIFALSSRHVRDVMVAASGSSPTAASPGSTRTSSPPPLAPRRDGCGRAWTRSAHPFEPKGV